MTYELTELVGFLHDKNPQVRQIALENLIGYSVHTSPHVDIFKQEDLRPVRDLKVLLISQNAVLALVNLCHDEAVLQNLSKDDDFVDLVLDNVTDERYISANLASMLLANLTKTDRTAQEVLKSTKPATSYSSSKRTLDQLMDCFVKGADGAINDHANFDYLSYVFANISRLPEGRRYFIERQEYDGVIPISKLAVFSNHRSLLRRTGIASTIKNACFDLESHPTFLDEDQINLLPYILLPLCGSDDFSIEDMDGMPEDLQMLPPDKEREADKNIIIAFIESLLLLTAAKPGRQVLRDRKVYPVIRELHLAHDDDEVRDACERLVQILMRDEANGEQTDQIKEIESDEDEKIIEIV